MVTAVFAGGGPMDGAVLEVEMPPPPAWITRGPVPPLAGVAALRSGLDRPAPDPTRSPVEYRYTRVRLIEHVAAVYWYDPAGWPTPDEIRGALDRILG